jgi:hypothetical protein
MRTPLTPPYASITKLRKAVNQRAAIERLALACQFARAHLSKPMFQRRVKMNGRWVIIRLEWPCTMSVFDVKTGQLLAQSLPDRPGCISLNFDAPDPDPLYMLPDPKTDSKKLGGRNDHVPCPHCGHKTPDSTKQGGRNGQATN